MPHKNELHILAMRGDGIVVPASGAGFADVEITNDKVIIGQRGFLEESNKYRQLIPYIVFTHKGKVMGYARTTSSGESRLHGKVSVGAGGHVDFSDVQTTEDSTDVIDIEATMKLCADREIEEELKFGEGTSVVSESVMHEKIVANVTPVDEVHIGVVVKVELSDEDVTSNEDAVDIIGFKTPKEWIESGYEFETWTDIVLKDML